MTLFNAEISAGSLLPLESRRIAKLLLSKPDEASWQHAIEIDNILQKKTVATARRQTTLLRKRLTTLDASAWQMIAERESEVVNQLLLAASVKHSQLLGRVILFADRCCLKSTLSPFALDIPPHTRYKHGYAARWIHKRHKSFRTSRSPCRAA